MEIDCFLCFYCDSWALKQFSMIFYWIFFFFALLTVNHKKHEKKKQQVKIYGGLRLISQLLRLKSRLSEKFYLRQITGEIEIIKKSLHGGHFVRFSSFLFFFF